MNEKWIVIRKSSFLSKISGLTVATIISQVISMLMVAVMARLFDKAEIGTYYVCMSIVAIIGNFSLLGYQFSMPSADKHEANLLATGMLGILLAVSGASSAFFFLNDYLFVVPLVVLIFVGGLNQLSNMLNLREQKIKLLGVSRIAISGNNLFIVFLLDSLEKHSAEELLWGNALSTLIFSVIYFIVSARGYILPIGKMKEVYVYLRRNRKNPLYLTSGDFFNSLAYNLPTIILERYFSAGWAAQYGIVLKFCDAPVNLLGSTISQVYFSSLANSVRTNEAYAYKRFKRMFKGQIFLSIICSIVIAGAFPWVILNVLGPGWGEAEEMVMIFAPMYGMMLLLAPLSAFYYVFQQQNFLLKVQILYLFIAVISFAAGIYFKNVWLAICLFSFLATLRYLFILKNLLKFSKEIKKMGANNA